MLSLFPDLFDWSWYVPFFFRIFLGVYFCYVGWMFARNDNMAAVDDDRAAWAGMRAFLILLGLLFIFGVAVQALGSVGFVLALSAIFFRSKLTLLARESVVFYILIGMVSLSLVFLGPGPFAFDMPL